MNDNSDREKIKKTQLLLLLPIGIDFVIMVILGIFQVKDIYPIFASILVLLGIVEIVLAFKRKNIPQREIAAPESEHVSDTKEKEEAINPDDLPENASIRKKIWKFDSFVRDNYPQLPLEEINFSNEELDSLIQNVNLHAKLDADILKPIVNKMLKHLNQKFNYASIEVNRVEPGQINQAGHIESTTHRIVVNYDGHMTYRNILALLAHEISHAYQFYEFSKYPGEEREVEEFTDFLTYYLGFGALVDNGYNYSYFDDKRCEHRVRLGYLNDYALSFSRTTMNGRKTMKEIKLEEAEEIRIIKNKIKQINDIIPEYLSIVSGIIENLTHCKDITHEDLEEISSNIMEHQSFNIASVNAINDRAIKETELKELKSIQKEMNTKAREIYRLYDFFSRMSNKYIL